MASHKQIAILFRSVDEWNSWRNEKSYDRLDLSGADLASAVLEGVNLEGVNLCEANLNRADLQDADLRKAALRDTQLRRASLSGADLSEADLQSADLDGADLSGANLSSADLSGTDLSGTNLSGANLSGANLSRSILTATNFTEAILRNSDFTGSACNETVFANVDLSATIGLNAVWHDGPSIISIETLYRTKIRLPDVFLRGCGVPEVLITYLPALLENAIQFYSCFISYSHDDYIFARRVHDTLQGRGIRCWLDEQQMNPGDDIYAEVDRAIKVWDKVLLCCSKSALTEKWWVDMEINKAFQKERDLMKERGEKVLALIPLDIDGYLFNPEYQTGKTDEIRSRIAADFTGWEHDNAIFEREIERVIKALRTDGGKEPPPKAKI